MNDLSVAFGLSRELKRSSRKITAICLKAQNQQISEFTAHEELEGVQQEVQAVSEILKAVTDNWLTQGDDKRCQIT